MPAGQHCQHCQRRLTPTQRRKDSYCHFAVSPSHSKCSQHNLGHIFLVFKISLCSSHLPLNPYWASHTQLTTMARARIRKNPQRRRRDYNKKKLLQEHCASLDQQSAQADGAGDGAGPASNALPSDKNAPGPKTTSTADQKTSSSEPKQRCKPRKVPVSFSFLPFLPVHQ